MAKFLNSFRRFLCDFPIFLTTGFNPEIPTNRDRNVNKSVPSVESINLKMIIEAKIGQTGRRTESATLLTLLGFESNYDLYRLQSCYNY